VSNGVFITIQALLAEPTVTAVVGDRIHPVRAPQGDTLPNIVVHLIAEPVDPLLCEDAPVSRVQIDSRAGDATTAITLGETVSTTLNAINNQTIATKRATFQKEGSDVTGENDKADTIIRSTDFDVHWWNS